MGLSRNKVAVSEGAAGSPPFYGEPVISNRILRNSKVESLTKDDEIQVQRRLLFNFEGLSSEVRKRTSREYFVFSAFYFMFLKNNRTYTNMGV